MHLTNPTVPPDAVSPSSTYLRSRMGPFTVPQAAAGTGPYVYARFAPEPHTFPPTNHPSDARTQGKRTKVSLPFMLPHVSFRAFPPPPGLGIDNCHAPAGELPDAPVG
ncbi:hypothetical protein S7711_11164 [Stachybotrys chartarum IBT 7711]|uniref:Uncharacterized protein n=1 Tax=Stachybotrys chartarum (strain CBS 109288 / IBT 7711) TaxID=1280523 RepID=A0A084AK63_STACB|nr:hypothetical protein S7711_11164 [Stachybotrys chartarum IBT 7711]